MSRISQKNFERIAESVLRVLYDSFPIALSTTQVAQELARDNEFIGRVLEFLEKKGYVQRKARENRVDWLLTRGMKAQYDKLV
ncbi:MAG: hypothetical protein QXR53_04070 [Candidatus Norongarragalinales archaeon]